MEITNKDIENINKLRINSTYTLKNKSIIKAIKDDDHRYNTSCKNCYLNKSHKCHKIDCLMSGNRVGRIFIKIGENE